MAFPSEKHFVKDKSGRVDGYLRKANGTEMKVFKIFSPDTVNAPHYFFYNAGGKFFEDGNFSEAIRYYKRGLELYPNTLSLEGDLAHSYLFNNNYDAAVKIYKAHLDEKLPDGREWADMIKQDFIYLKNNKYDKILMDRVFADLKWKMPPEYKN
jgi:tetratricopeptide (TPR) repeat protein